MSKQGVIDIIKGVFPDSMHAPLRTIYRAMQQIYLNNIASQKWLHSSDLLLPGPEGYSGMQLIIVSRLMDTELWLQGEEMKWHLVLSGVDDVSQRETANRKYAMFLEKISINGFSPAISYWELGRFPRLGITDGTHRLGYLLSRQKNMFLPVRILNLGAKFPYSNEGKSYFIGKGVAEAHIDQIMERYGQLLHEIRTWMCGFLDYEFYECHEKNITEIFGRYCNKFSAERVFDSKRLLNVLGYRLKSRIKNTSKIILFKYELKYQDMYYMNGCIRSKAVDRIESDLEKSFGGGILWYYLAPTVSESVLVESYFDEVKANL